MPLPSSSTLVAALVAACGLAGLLFLFPSVRRLRRRRYGACTVHGLSSLVFFLAAVAVVLLGLDLLTYDRLTREQTVRSACSLAQADRSSTTRPSPTRPETIRGYVLSGDEWQIERG